MDRLTAMQVFVEVAERSSFTSAADALDMSRAMVARYVVGLEEWLGVRLLHRTTRRVSLTDAGAEAIERCRLVLETARDAQVAAGARRIEPSGRIRITAASSFAQAHLASAVIEFLTRHPKASVELIATEHAVNLVEERIDLAVRIGKRVDEGLVARRLAACRSVICASPAYLATHGAPRTPDDLTRLRCITHAYVGRSQFVLVRDGQVARVPVLGALQSNDTSVTRQAVLDGGGIALLPTYFVSKDLASGDLVRLLPDYEPEPLAIHAAYLSRDRQPPLLRLMLDFLIQRFAGEVAPWDREIAANEAMRRGVRKTRRGVRNVTRS